MQATNDKLYDIQETGLDGFTNKGLKAFLREGTNHKIIGQLDLAFLRAEIDSNDSRAASVICANRILNGAKLQGFGKDSPHHFLSGYRQMQVVISSSEQALKTFQSIKPETLAQYKEAIYIILKP